MSKLISDDKHFGIECVLVENQKIYKAKHYALAASPILAIKKFIKKYLPETSEPEIYKGGGDDLSKKYISYKMKKTDSDGIFYLSCQYDVSTK